MRTIYLSFEFALMLVFFWAGWWNLHILNSPTSDWGTIVGAILFFAFGFLILGMLFNEASLIVRARTGVEINPVRMFAVRYANSTPDDQESED